MGDVSKLLHDYKGLALQYESLSRGVAKMLASLNRGRADATCNIINIQIENRE